MQPVFNLGTYTLLFGCFLCALASVLLAIHSIRKNPHNRWLSFYYLAVGYGLFGSFLLYSHFIVVYPWYYLYRTPYIVGILFMPVSLFYMRSLLQQKAFRRFDWLHFIPLFIYLIDFAPYFAKSGAFKLQDSIAATQLNAPWRNFSEGWLGIGRVYMPFRLVQGLFYWIWQINLIRQIQKMQNKKIFLQENKHIIQWARLFCAAQALYFIPFFLNTLFGPYNQFFEMQLVSSAIGASITILALLLKPDILFGLKGIFIHPEPESKQAAEVTDKKIIFQEMELSDMPLISLELNPIVLERKSSYFSFQKMKEVDEVMLSHLTENKPYLNKRYSAHNLSSEIRIQPYLISAVINQIHKNHFNDYINRFRVEHAKSLIDGGEGKFFTLEALAEQSGFNNRNSFRLAFKKYARQTPSEYIRSADLIA